MGSVLSYDTSQEFSFGAELGRGGYGIVYALNYNGRPTDRAIKKIGTVSGVSKTELTKALQEVNTMKSLDHPNILRIYGHFFQGPALCIVMERCSESLRKRLTRSISLLDFGLFTQQIAQALEYLESQSIIHRDLKPENILILEGTLKIADFGLAKAIDAVGPAITFCGTSGYIAPEVDPQQRHTYTLKADWYSFGIIIGEIWKKVPLTFVQHDSHVKADLVAKLTSINPNARPSPSKVHTWAFNFYQAASKEYETMLNDKQQQAEDVKQAMANLYAQLQKIEKEITALELSKGT